MGSNTVTSYLRRRVDALSSIRDQMTGVLNDKLTSDLVVDDQGKYTGIRDKIVNEVNNLGTTVNNLNAYIDKCENMNKNW